jgi:hypothetical protein
VGTGGTGDRTRRGCQAAALFECVRRYQIYSALAKTDAFPPRYFKEDGICDIFSQLFLDYGTFKILSISPTQIPPSFGHPQNKYRHLELAGDAEPKTLFNQLPATLKWMDGILTADTDCKPRVEVHCKDEVRGQLVACAYCERHLQFFLVLYLSQTNA